MNDAGQALTNLAGLSDLRLCLAPGDRRQPYGSQQQAVMARDDLRQAVEAVRAWPSYRPTPLVTLPALARRLGLGTLEIKDEGRRFAVGSFKALGPPYAVARLLAQEIARQTHEPLPAMSDLLAGCYRSVAASIGLCAATSGNHGRALAWAARLFGCRCVIYMPQATSPYRERAIRDLGADVVRVPGNYDESLRRAVADAQREGWIVIGEVPPAAWPDVPRQVLHGYAVLGAELAESWAASRPPTHVFVSAGSGKLAAAVTAALWLEYGERRPSVVVVQPHTADCVYQSGLARQRAPAAGNLVTLMDGLSVGQVSPLAWPLLASGAAAFMTIPDSTAVQALRALARPSGGDPPVELGETGVAAIAGVLATAANDEARQALQLDADSRVVAIGCEGVTDPDIYRNLLSGES